MTTEKPAYISGLSMSKYYHSNEYHGYINLKLPNDGGDMSITMTKDLASKLEQVVMAHAEEIRQQSIAKLNTTTLVPTLTYDETKTIDESSAVVLDENGIPF